MSRAATASLLFLATLSGCSSLSRNHERGLAAVGAVATLFGATTIADGMSCDSRYHHGSTCTTDRGELRDGAIITTAGVALLGADPSTRVVILLSKPPAASVATTLIEAAGKVDKPVVVCFIGADAPAGLPGNVTFVPTSSEAALTAMRLATGDDSLERPALPEVDLEAVRAA